jgi:uncharacterized protein YbbC (DUF1343 family)
MMLAGCAGRAPDPVRPGIDVLLADSARLVLGRRVGILTNQTGIDRSGRDDLSRLREGGVTVTAIFSPEHGFRGARDVENIGHGVDSATGLPIFSLYGPVREPTRDMLGLIDVLVIDLQDIGARPYTYVSTALHALRAAAAANVPVLVLDRPDPIGGTLVQGPLLDTAFASSIGMLPVPLRHGMTIGELARLGNVELGIDGRLTVIPVAGWRRGEWFNATGLPWVRPSPSMPNLESATHYPGLVLFEATDLSVGRGTPVAFQVIGAPWLDAKAVVAAMGGATGVRLGDTTVTPVAPPDGKFDGLTISCVRLLVTDRMRYDPIATAVRLLAAVRRVHPGAFAVDSARFDLLAGTDRLRRAIVAGVEPDSIIVGWEPALARFRETRRPYLLY